MEEHEKFEVYQRRVQEKKDMESDNHLLSLNFGDESWQGTKASKI